MWSRGMEGRGKRGGHFTVGDDKIMRVLTSESHRSWCSDASRPAGLGHPVAVDSYSRLPLDARGASEALEAVL